MCIQGNREAWQERGRDNDNMNDTILQIEQNRTDNSGGRAIA